MELTHSSVASLDEAFRKIVELYSGEEEDQLLSTDFYFQPLQEEGRLVVFNDNDEVIINCDIPEWERYDSETFYDAAATDIAAAMEKANAEGELERLAVWMPYSFVLVDDDRETVADLLLVDDDTLLVKKGLMAGLDEDLNQFIEELLSE